MPGSQTIPIRFIFPLAILAVAAFAASWMATTALADDHEGADTIVIRNGDGEPGYTVNAFLPQEITVSTGTTVRWEFPFGEPHSTTFGEPGPETPSGADFDGTENVNSGVIFGGEGQSWELNFVEAGEFEFHCIIHPFQTMTVTVVDDGEVDTQADVDARADAYYADALERVQQLGADLQGAPVETEDLGDGTIRWTVVNGGATEDGHDALIYAPSPLTITEGDTVRWTADTPVPHSVSFGPAPDFEDPWEVAPEIPRDAYDGEGFWHSGTMFGVPDAIPDTIQEFELVFNTPGEYDYYCVFHRHIGHVGQLTVEAADGEPVDEPTDQPTPEAPATGTGTATGSPVTVYTAGGAVLAVIALSLVAARAARAASVRN